MPRIAQEIEEARIEEARNEQEYSKYKDRSYVINPLYEMAAWDGALVCSACKKYCVKNKDWIGNKKSTDAPYPAKVGRLYK